jgi:quercetin dioxygenase-like cupin family protein
MKRPVSMTRVPTETAYEEWTKSEGVPVYEDWGIEDVKELERKPWARMGGKGAFIHLKGMKEYGICGMYVMEIPPGQSLNPEKHLYEELIYVLRGQGATEIWQEGQAKRSFEWGAGSFFAPPLNAWHRLYNGSREPVIFLAMTTAPIVVDLFHNVDFVFGDSYAFTDRYAGEETYFKVGQPVQQNLRGNHKHQVWDTNFIPDLTTDLGRYGLSQTQSPSKAEGGMSFGFEMSENVLTGHVGDWPVGVYHRAHYHGPGAVLLGLKSNGYVLLWHKELGTHPYENGHGDEVIKLNWREGAVYSPGDGWFHQHFNTGPEPARHIALRTGGAKYRVGVHRYHGVVEKIQEGGTMIDYKDEDPQIRRDFEAALKEAGVKSQMPPVDRTAA